MRAEQVKVHSGLVRCGACRGIFDAVEHLIEGTLPRNDPPDDEFGSEPPRTIIQGMAAMQDSADVAPKALTPKAIPVSPATSPLRAASAAASVAAPVPLQKPPITPAPKADLEPDIEHIEIGPVGYGAVDERPDRAFRHVDLEATESVPVRNDEADALSRYHWREPERKASRASRWVYGFLSLLALVGLIAQAAYFFRDEIANRVPQLAPSLANACEYVGCRLQPPRRSESLGFVGSDLAADPAHKGLLIFTATLRNTGDRTVAYPHLVLTLDGLGGQMVARRVFAPKEFAPANANVAHGLDGGAEIEIKLYLDASQANVVGFKVDHAYL